MSIYKSILESVSTAITNKIAKDAWKEKAHDFKILDSFNNYKKILKQDWLWFSGENWDWREGRVIRGIGIWVKQKDWTEAEYWAVDIDDINEWEKSLEYGKGRNAKVSIKKVAFWVQRRYEKVFEEIFKKYPELEKTKCFFVSERITLNKTGVSILIYEE